MGHVRLQAIIAAVAIILLVVVMAYVGFSVTTVTVPDRGGTYVEGVAGNPQAINPILSRANTVDQDLVALVFSGLTRVDDRLTIVPDLAERWEIGADGTVYTFYLRPDVTWHDGAPLYGARRGLYRAGNAGPLTFRASPICPICRARWWSRRPMI